MQISIVEMGRTKKRTVRESVISILGKEFPLSTKKIFNRVKKEYNLSVTYQAVYKMIKDMEEDRIIVKDGREYQLNVEWINQLENEIKVLKHTYLGGKTEDGVLSDRINSFVSKVGPKLKSNIKENPACIIGVSGGGRFFAIALWKYLTREGLDINYVDFDLVEESSSNDLKMNKKKAIGRVLVVVDSAVYSGNTYELILNKLEKFKSSLKVERILFVVDNDVPGIADISSNRISK